VVVALEAADLPGAAEGPGVEGRADHGKHQ